eukprot:COSAG03_NODE_1491_length_3984_cov_79.859238_3_plen_196_part_00
MVRVVGQAGWAIKHSRMRLFRLQVAGIAHSPLAFLVAAAGFGGGLGAAHRRRRRRRGLARHRPENHSRNHVVVAREMDSTWALQLATSVSVVWRAAGRGADVHHRSVDLQRESQRERERERERESESVCECVRACVCEGERERDIGCRYLQVGHDIIRCGIEREHVSVVALRTLCHREWHRGGGDPDHALRMPFQ